MEERHVIEGELRIEKQRDLIARLKRVGHEASIDAAIIFLGQLEDFQRLSIEHRNRERAKSSDSN